MTVHIYHYNMHSEKRYFLGREHHSLYDMISLNGNIVSNTPAGIAAFLATSGKKFFIDPQTHAFQHATINLKRDISNKEKGEPPKYEFKPSIEKLALERLKIPFKYVIDEDRPISLTDFFSNSKLNLRTIEQACQGVIDLQTKTIIESLDDESKELLGEENEFKPEFIIAPYFYLSPQNFKDWLKINIACYNKTKELIKDIPVFIELVISKEVLNQPNYSGILQNIKDLKPDGIIIWIDEHKEENLIGFEIGNYIKFIKELKSITDTIYNIHCGYLSMLLSHSEIGSLLNGIGHAINYGEHRSVIPVGGGIPRARFYFPSIHSRLRFGDALGIVQAKKSLSSIEEYKKNICSCSQCIKLIKEKNTLDDVFDLYGEGNVFTFRRRPGSIVSMEYPTSEAKQAAANHYLYNKAHELDEIDKKPFKELLEDMKDTYEEIAKYSGDELVAHLYKWYSELNRL